MPAWPLTVERQFGYYSDVSRQKTVRFASMSNRLPFVLPPMTGRGSARGDV